MICAGSENTELLQFYAVQCSSLAGYHTDLSLEPSQRQCYAKKVSNSTRVLMQQELQWLPSHRQQALNQVQAIQAYARPWVS